MNLRDLSYLVAVADQRHFRRAADLCHVSQPTLSGQLKKLESHLGVQLFERSNRQVLLTPVGEEIVARARLILDEAETIETLAKEHTDPMRGRVRIGLIPTLAPYLLPLITEPLRERYPNLELLLHEAQTEVLLTQVRNVALDLIILAVPVDDDGLETKNLFEEPFLVALPEEHRLVDVDLIDTQCLSAEQVLLLEDGHCLRGQALDVCFTAGAKEKTDFRATSLETLKHMVSAGYGITLVPELAAQGFGDTGGKMRFKRFQEPSPSRTIGMMYRNASSKVGAFEAIGEVIRDEASAALSTELLN